MEVTADANSYISAQDEASLSIAEYTRRVRPALTIDSVPTDRFSVAVVLRFMI